MAGEATVQLRNVCVKIGSGATPRGGKEAYKGGSTSLIRSQNIYNEGFHREGLVYIDEDQSAELRNVEVKPNDVLLNITGDSVARCCQVAPDVLPARVNQHVAIIRPQPNSLDARFLRYVLVSHQYQSRLLALASAGATRPALTKSMIEELHIPSPPLAEQKAIAAVLGALDDKIELNRRMNATLQAMARALFQSWFVDFDPVRAKLDGRKPAGLDDATASLFPDLLEESTLGHIPKGWTAGQLGDIGTNSRRSVQPSDIALNTPYIALEHMPRRCIALGDWDDSADVASGKSAFKKGEILFGKLRPYFHKVGVAPFDGVCSTDILVLAPKSPEWFGFLLGHASSDELIQFTDLASTGTKMPRTNWSDISSFKVALPPKPIAAAFTRNMQPLIDRIHANLHQSRTLATLRDTLLPKLLSGELSVVTDISK
jgi:type I restriction enzyme S subunit